jgi:hypothetical protein
MSSGKEIAELIEKSAEFEGDLSVMLTDLKVRIAASGDPQEKEVLSGLVRAMENFLSLKLSTTLLEKVPEEGNA